MKKIAIILLSTFLFLPRTVDSTERDGELSEAQKETFQTQQRHNYYTLQMFPKRLVLQLLA